MGRVRTEVKKNTESKISDIPAGVLRVVQQSRYGWVQVTAHSDVSIIVSVNHGCSTMPKSVNTRILFECYIVRSQTQQRRYSISKE